MGEKVGVRGEAVNMKKQQSGRQPIRRSSASCLVEGWWRLESYGGSCYVRWSDVIGRRPSVGGDVTILFKTKTLTHQIGLIC